MTTLVLDPPATAPLAPEALLSAPEETREWLQRYLRQAGTLTPAPTLFDMRQFCVYLASLDADTLAGEASIPGRCPLRNWRAAEVSAVWGFTYLEAQTGLKHELPLRAQVFVAWLDLLHAHQHVLVKQVLPLAQQCASLPEELVSRMLDHLRALIWRR